MTAIARVTHIRLANGDVVQNDDGSPLLFGLTHDRVTQAGDGSSQVQPGAVSWAQVSVHPGGKLVAEVTPGFAFSHEQAAATEYPVEAPRVTSPGLVREGMAPGQVADVAVKEGMRFEDDTPIAPKTRIIDGSAPAEPGQTVGYDSSRVDYVDEVIAEPITPAPAFG